MLDIKLSIILFDIGLAVLISLLVLESQRKAALLVWVFNPVSLWASAAVGQVDVMPTFFIILAWLLVKKNKLNLAALSLGVGGALKSFPFLLAPFLIMLAKTWRQRVFLSVLTITPLIISVLPYFPSRTFRQNALFAPQIDKMLYSKIPLSGGEAVILTVSLLVLLYIVYLKRDRHFGDLINFSTAALLIVLAFTHFHIQWALWVTPLLILKVFQGIGREARMSILILGVALLGMLFLFEQSLQVGLFSPVFPGLTKAVGLAEILKPDQLNLFKGILASVFAASAVYLSYLFVSEKSSA